MRKTENTCVFYKKSIGNFKSAKILSKNLLETELQQKKNTKNFNSEIGLNDSKDHFRK